MYVLNMGRSSIVDGRRISYGDIPRDEGKRMRLATPTTKAIASRHDELLEKKAQNKYKPGAILRKWGLAKYLPANNRALNNHNKDGKSRKDALRSISTDEDGISAPSKKRKMSPYASYTKNQRADDIISSNDAKADRIASFKQAYAAKEVISDLAAKRQKIMSALAKQNIHVEYHSPQVADMVTCGNYACTTIQSSALKLRLTKIDDGSSRKRKREC